MQYFVSFEVKDVHLVLNYSRTWLVMQLFEQGLDWLVTVGMLTSARKVLFNLSFAQRYFPLLEILACGCLYDIVAE